LVKKEPLHQDCPRYRCCAGRWRDIYICPHGHEMHPVVEGSFIYNNCRNARADGKPSPNIFLPAMIANEFAPTGVVENAGCRSGFSRDIFIGADHSHLTEGPLPLAWARGIWCGADFSAIDMGRRYRENRA